MSKSSFSQLFNDFDKCLLNSNSVEYLKDTYIYWPL